MLTRLYVDNYKCLVNFDLTIRPLQLFLGVNGSGKSTVFEVLSILRGFLFRGQPSDSLFAARSLTRWQTLDLQVFELEVSGNGGQYCYKLKIGHDRSREQSRVEHELLTFDQHVLFKATLGEGQLYRDDFSEGPSARFDWSRSGVAALGQRPDNKRLTWFKNWMGRLYCLYADPHGMRARTESEEAHPSHDLSNFASWYRHLMQEQPVAVADLHKFLAQIIDGFKELSLGHKGEEIRVLRLTQKVKKSAKTMELDFDELSDGQRVLIALYTLLHCSAEENVTLCIDEPDNFLALAEIQPWLAALSDKVEDGRCQVLLLSHHPELINYLARDCGLLFRRFENGPTQVRPFQHDSDGKLSDAELVARSWEDE